MVGLKDLKGKRALITGGSSGIGLSTAAAMLKKGVDVIIAARDREKMQKVMKDHEGVSSFYQMDVSNWKDVTEVKQKISGDLGKIDILVNSAGIVHPGVLKELDHDQVVKMLDIDLLGTINTCKAFLDIIKKPGYIVNVSSVAGFIGIYGYTAYSAAKFGVWGFSQALRMELEPDGIGIGVVFPPDTDTPQLEFENRTKPSELRKIAGTIRPISPEKVADSIIRGIQKGEFMIFPDRSSRSAYHANRLAGPAVRGWMDGKVRSSRE